MNGYLFPDAVRGYFEELDSQRGIAWRYADSLSLRNFVVLLGRCLDLFLEASQQSPDHSSLTRIRERLPLFVHEQAFAFVLEIARQKKLLRGDEGRRRLDDARSQRGNEVNRAAGLGRRLAGVPARSG